MKFKMRVVNHSPTGNAQAVGGVIAKQQKTTNDGIPPSYPIQNEKLLFIGIESKGRSFDDQLINFCRDLTPERVHNVAIYNLHMRNNVPDIQEIVDIIKADGINVIDDILTLDVKGGLFKKSRVTEKNIEEATAWAEKVVNTLV